MRPPARSRLPLLALLIVVLLGALTPLPAHAQARTHTVRPGDTLSEIAAAYGTDVATLRQLNGISGNLIRIGQELILPRGAVSGAGAGSAVAPRPAAGSSTYTVRQGDNLSRIAQRFGVSMEAILQANALANPRLITPGQTLIIPAGGRVTNPATNSPAAPSGPADPGKWIDVDLSAQRVTAYLGESVIRSFRVSTGLPATPTVTGRFRIRLKMPTQDMRGASRAGDGGYFLNDVPWVQYFFQDYAFHGTTWHNSFGTPASHGCINMSVADAQWLFDWSGPVYDPDGYYWQGATNANPGTLVVIHE